jgi:hypothetical protein
LLQFPGDLPVDRLAGIRGPFADTLVACVAEHDFLADGFASSEGEAIANPLEK